MSDDTYTTGISSTFRQFIHPDGSIRNYAEDSEIIVQDALQLLRRVRPEGFYDTKGLPENIPQNIPAESKPVNDAKHPMAVMKEYRVLTATNADELAKQVEALLKEGWWLVGPASATYIPSMWKNEYMQTLTRDNSDL